MEWLLLVVGIVAVVMFNNRLSGLQRRIGELEGMIQRLAADVEGVGRAKPAPRPRAQAPAAPAASVSGPVEIPSELKPLAPAVAEAPVAAMEIPSQLPEALLEIPAELPAAAAEEPAELPVAPEAPARKPAWPKAAASSSDKGATAGAPPPPRPPEPPKPASEPVDWEKLVGVRLPVWGGAIMLLIAGFFLINWAIESGAYLFTPAVRVGLCGLAALGLLAAAFIVKARGIANGERIASALAAAAIAVGYGTMFLAAAVFHLVPDAVALAGAGLIAVVAIAIASQFGQRVMLVGLLGGYLSPLFAWSSETTSTVLGIYVMVLLAVSMFAIRWNGWWGQAIPAIVAPALWALALVFGSDSVTLAILHLLLAAVPTAVALLPLRDDSGAEKQKFGLILPGFAAAAICLVVGAFVKDFDPPLLVALVLLGMHGAALVARRGDALRPAWIASLAAALAVLVSWERPEQGTFLVVALALAVIHLGALLAQYHRGGDRARRAFEIAGLSGIFFVILLVRLDGWLGARDVPYLWAAIALAVAALYGLLAVRLRATPEGHGASAGFAVGASAFLSLALGLVLDPGLYALVAALQALGLALLYLSYRVPVLKQMHVVYAVLYGVLLATGQVMAAGTRVFYEVEAWGWLQFIPSTGVAEAPLTLLLLPGLAFLAAATAFARIDYTNVPRALDAAGVILVAVALHFITIGPAAWRLLEHPLVLGAWWFNALGLVALAASYAAWRLNRIELFRAGIGVAVVMALGLLAAVMLPVFRFWTAMDVPGPPVFNLALVAILLPSLLLLGVAAMARRLGWLQVARGLAAFGGLGGLVTILVVIRQAIHGPTLMGPGAVSGQIELYSYSIGMLAYGFALLWAGVAFSSLALRAGSLVVVLATIGKVFFYDIGGLEGLWRVGSFLGLGIALLVVSWFYGRFVFGIGPSGSKAKPEAGPVA